MDIDVPHRMHYAHLQEIITFSIFCYSTVLYLGNEVKLHPCLFLNNIRLYFYPSYMINYRHDTLHLMNDMNANLKLFHWKINNLVDVQKSINVHLLYFLELKHLLLFVDYPMLLHH